MLMIGLSDGRRILGGEEGAAGGEEGGVGGVGPVDAGRRVEDELFARGGVEVDAGWGVLATDVDGVVVVEAVDRDGGGPSGLVADDPVEAAGGGDAEEEGRVG